MTEREIFAAALEMCDVQARNAYLQSVCGDDTPLREGVETLLRAYGDAGSFLEVGAVPPVGLTQSDLAGAESDSALDLLSPAEREDLLGTIDHYEVHSLIGRGGMGVVFKAHDPQLDRIVALKVLAPEYASNVNARKRFLREAQATAAVSHPHVVAIYAVDEGKRPPGDRPRRVGNLPYLVMEYISGQTLRDKIEREGALSVAAILRIGSQIAQGLAAAHRQGLIHRDVKPANVLLENGVERVKLTDFGLARAVDDVRMTRTGEVAGTPQFMSPEQAQGLTVDPRSDLFSLGSVLYTMCTGRPPFRGETVISVIRRVCDEDPRPIRDVNPEMPDWLANIVHRLLAKDPDDRFLSAENVAAVLDEHLALWQRGGPMPKGPPVAQPVRRGWQSWRRRPRLAAAGLFAAVALLVGISEAAGVTDVSSTIVSVLRGHGTLVIAISDPQISVAIDGDDLVITGAGAKEIRIPAGVHELTISQPGTPPQVQLVTVKRGGREVVSARLVENLAPRSSRSDRHPPAPASARNALHLARADLDAIMQVMNAAYPEAHLGVNFTSLRLTLHGEAKDQEQADEIMARLRRELVQKQPHLEPALRAEGNASGELNGLLLVNGLRIRNPDPAVQTGRPIVQGSDPDWTADGRELLFTGKDGGCLYAIDLTTRRLRLLLKVNRQFFGQRFLKPVSSPEGEWIAFVTQPSSGEGESWIWVVPVQGGEPMRIASGTSPSWSLAEGEALRLFYVAARDGQQRLYSIPADAIGVGSPTPATPQECGSLPSPLAVVAPDGSEVVTWKDGEVVVRSVKDPSWSVNWPLPMPLEPIDLRWSPDSRFVLVIGRTADETSTFIVRRATNEVRKLTLEQNAIRGVWSPNGKQLVLELESGPVNDIRLYEVGSPEGTAAVLGKRPAAVTTDVDLGEFLRDFDLVARAARGELHDADWTQLAAIQHPLVGQFADPSTKSLVQLFRSLTDRELAELRFGHSLVWNYSDLSEDRQQVYRDALQAALDNWNGGRSSPPESLSLEALTRARVGFAIVDVPEDRARLVSWFMLLPEHPAPIWVTVVNARHAGTLQYFDAHHLQLSRLRATPVSDSLMPDDASTQGTGEQAPGREGPRLLATRQLQVQVAAKKLAHMRFLAEQGAISQGEIGKATIEWMEAKIALAEAQANHSEVTTLSNQLIEEFEAKLQRVQSLHEEGIVPHSEVLAAEQELLEQQIARDLRLKSRK